MEQQQQQPQIPWDKTTAIKCTKCESETFEQVVLRRSMSKFVSGLPDDVELNAPVIRCTECKTIPEKFMAPFNPFKQVKDVKNE